MLRVEYILFYFDSTNTFTLKAELLPSNCIVYFATLALLFHDRAIITGIIIFTRV